MKESREMSDDYSKEILEWHNESIRDLNQKITNIDHNLYKVGVEISVIRRSLKTIIEKNSGTGIMQAIKANIKIFTAVIIPSVGIIVTILYEIGKYLRNLPVN